MAPPAGRWSVWGYATPSTCGARIATSGCPCWCETDLAIGVVLTNARYVEIGGNQPGVSESRFSIGSTASVRQIERLRAIFRESGCRDTWSHGGHARSVKFKIRDSKGVGYRASDFVLGGPRFIKKRDFAATAAVLEEY